MNRISYWFCIWSPSYFFRLLLQQKIPNKISKHYEINISSTQNIKHTKFTIQLFWWTSKLHIELSKKSPAFEEDPISCYWVMNHNFIPVQNLTTLMYYKRWVGFVWVLTTSHALDLYIQHAKNITNIILFFPTIWKNKII